MFEIDRSLMVVKPKQPFLDWARRLDDESEDLTLDHVRDDSLVYLIPQLWDNSDQQVVLEWCYAFVFEAELEAWHTDPEAWPQGRNLNMFLEWFEVEFHSLVFDLCDEPIRVIKDEPVDDSERETEH